MNTAMQALIIHFKEMNKSGWFSIDEIEQEILDFGIETEKQQIIDAFNSGLCVKKDSSINIDGGDDYYIKLTL